MPLEPAAMAGVPEGLGAVETRPDGAAGRSAGPEGARTHAPWAAAGSPSPGGCRRAGLRAPGCWSPPCCGLVGLRREIWEGVHDAAMLSGFLLSASHPPQPQSHLARSCLATEVCILQSQCVQTDNLVASRPPTESGRANVESGRLRPSDTLSPHFSDLFAGSPGERGGGRSSRGTSGGWQEGLSPTGMPGCQPRLWSVPGHPQACWASSISSPLGSHSCS